MTIDDFREFLRKKHEWPGTISVTIKPCLAITRTGEKLWEAYGYCWISSGCFDKILVEGYKAKSELPHTKETEERPLIDLLYEELSRAFMEVGIADPQWHFEPLKMVPWGSWN